jgi:NTE family protein
VRASIALPALFTPVMREGRILVDGGLVNPVPVSLARAMDADVVIAVDLNSDMLGRHTRKKQEPETHTAETGEWMSKLQQHLRTLMPAPADDEPRSPAMLDVIAASINIMQVRIGRSRMAGEPPDLIVTPRLSQLGLLDFHRSKEAIQEGKRAMEAALPSLRTLVDEFS